MNYDDTVLIKLRRDYSENETIMYALNKIKELQIEVGKQNSYIQELQDNPINLDLQKQVKSLNSQLTKEKVKVRRAKRPSDSKIATTVLKLTRESKKKSETITNLNNQIVKYKKKVENLEGQLKIYNPNLL